MQSRQEPVSKLRMELLCYIISSAAVSSRNADSGKPGSAILTFQFCSYHSFRARHKASEDMQDYNSDSDTI